MKSKDLLLFYISGFIAFLFILATAYASNNCYALTSVPCGGGTFENEVVICETPGGSWYTDDCSGSLSGSTVHDCVGGYSEGSGGCQPAEEKAICEEELYFDGECCGEEVPEPGLSLTGVDVQVPDGTPCPE